MSTTDTSFVPAWATWNYSGYESSGKARMNEYFGLISTMTKVGKNDGCGRAMWEYEPQLNEMGTPDALMLLPYWTDSCIGSMEGLYYESSATTPYHFLNAAELSEQPSDPVRGLNYPASPNVADEVSVALDAGKRVIPILIEACIGEHSAGPGNDDAGHRGIENVLNFWVRR